MGMLFVIIISELIILFIVIVCFNIIYVSSCLSYVSNIIINMWYCVNIYKSIVNYLDILLFVCIFVFIELQLKEYINYNGYMNTNIFTSILFITLGIHFIHISISTIIICYTYSFIVICKYNSIGVSFIITNTLVNVVVLLYWHLVSSLWYIITILIL